ncbi:MAG TPA: hypothetical protein VFN67_33150 [Polyangiales bacterium]|nr:hypothetical protein [Polyangiales bacterium]
MSDAGARSAANAATQADPSFNTCATSNVCEHEGRCVDSPSGVSCACEGTGFTGKLCDQDIDECAVGSGGCNPHAVCKNIPGARECVCGETQTGDGIGLEGCRERMTQVNAYSDGWAACALGANKRVYCWGSGGKNAFGDGNDAERTQATRIEGLEDVVMLGQGESRHACVVKSDKTVWCWGMNDLGQLGDGTNEPRYGPVRVANLDLVIEVSQGGGATCALHGAGVVSCWGAGWIVGNTEENAFQTRPTRLPSLSNVIRVRVGTRHACAVVRDGGLYCWGDSRPALDTMDNNKVPEPTLVTIARDVKEVMVGLDKTCALLRPSGVRCWGGIFDIPIDKADSGCIGGPIFLISGTALRGWGWVPEQQKYVEFTPARTEVKTIACSQFLACQVELDGQVYCWGNSRNGPMLVPGFVPE